MQYPKSLSVALLAFVLIGCGGAPPSGGAAMPMRGTPTAPPDTPCNDLSLKGTPAVQYLATHDAAQPFAGGTIVDGVYRLTSATVFTGPEGPTGLEPGNFTLLYRFSGRTLDIIGSTPAGTLNVSGTFTTSGASITTSGTCGASGLPFTESYSATATTVSLGQIVDGMGSVAELTRQ